ncbi:hypothetical protein FG386_002301 [Cryptosporidium ryanae]|uniref:uncharacterized protein n=1 Tax=Cryptosporidium ryanae TaxID=515981 RepID=UPI003519FAE8|nr:hypothetical protein FG386_002301 [Cryptosporidium ryanae]
MTQYNKVDGDVRLRIGSNNLPLNGKRGRCVNTEKNNMSKVKEMKEQFFQVNSVEAENAAFINNVYSYRNPDLFHSQCFYSTTSNQMNSRFVSVFQIKQDSNDVDLEKSDSCENKTKEVEGRLDISKYNSVIKEDKEKRKVILEWYRNNELFSKQWSCKKFGKEGAAKRAIQFLEKIHGISVNCFPDGYYSTLIEIGSLKDRSSDIKKQSVLLHSREKRKYKRKAKNQTILLVEDNENKNSNICEMSNVKTVGNLNKEFVLLIQRMMLLFLSLDTNNIHNNSDLTRERDKGELRDNLHLNCRKLLRKIHQRSVSNHNFTFNYKYDSQQISKYENDQTTVLNASQDSLDLPKGSNIDYFNNNSNQNNCYNSLTGIRNVKDILQKTTRKDIQINNSIEDIKKIINSSEQISSDFNGSIDSFLWDELIKNGSRINDDLHYLSEGGFPGNTSVCYSKYGDGHFRFNRGGILSYTNEQLENSLKLINHSRSCLNYIHVETERNGNKSMTRFEKRITRLQGRFNCNNNTSINESQNNVYDEKNTNSNANFVDDITDNHLEIENATYTLLDMRYGLNNFRSKDVLINDLSKIEIVNEKKRKINLINTLDEIRDGISIDKKNKISKKDSQVEPRKEDCDEESNSTLEWWKKPRGWKVSYYRGKHKYSKIFRVSLNSSGSERESQYKLAYEFFLSTQNRKKLSCINENTNTQNISTSDTNKLNIGIDGIMEKSNNSIVNNCGDNRLPFVFNYMGIPQFNGNFISPFNYCMPFLNYSPQFGIGTQSICNQVNNNENTTSNITNTIELQNSNNSSIQRNLDSYSNNKPISSSLPFNPPHFFQPFFPPFLPNINYHNMLINSMNLNNCQNINLDKSKCDVDSNKECMNVGIDSSIDVEKA